MTKGMQYGALACIAIVLGLFWLSDKDKQSQDTGFLGPGADIQLSEPLPYGGFTSDDLKSNLTNQFIQITSIPQLLSLNTGDTFRLQGASDNGSKEIEISITQYDAKDNYTQMQGTTTNNGLAIITVGNETVSVFIKEASGLYEFSGKGFDGVIPRIDKIVWGDDIYIDPQPANLREVQELAPVEIEVQQ